MSFYNFLILGCVLRVEDNRKSAVDGFYDPAEFWIDGEDLFCWCPELGPVKSDLSARGLDYHLQKMISEGLDVIIKHKKQFTKK